MSSDEAEHTDSGAPGGLEGFMHSRSPHIARIGSEYYKETGKHERACSDRNQDSLVENRAGVKCAKTQVGQIRQTNSWAHQEIMEEGKTVGSVVINTKQCTKEKHAQIMTSVDKLQKMFPVFL